MKRILLTLATPCALALLVGAFFSGVWVGRGREELPKNLEVVQTPSEAPAPPTAGNGVRATGQRASMLAPIDDMDLNFQFFLPCYPGISASQPLLKPDPFEIGQFKELREILFPPLSTEELSERHVATLRLLGNDYPNCVTEAFIGVELRITSGGLLVDSIEYSEEIKKKANYEQKYRDITRDPKLAAEHLRVTRARFGPLIGGAIRSFLLTADFGKMESVQPLCLTKEQESQIAHPPRAIARHGGRQSHGKYLPNIWKVEIAARRKDGAAWMHSYVVSAPLGLRDNRYATMLFVIARVSKPLADRFYFQDEWRKQDPKPLQIEEFTAIEWRRQSALEAPVSDDEVDSGKGNILLAGSIARIEKGVIDDKPILSRVPGDPVIRIEPNSEQRAFMEALAFIRKQKDPGALHALVRSINFVDRVRGEALSHRRRRRNTGRCGLNTRPTFRSFCRS